MTAQAESPRLPQQADVWSHRALLVPSARYLALFVLAAALVFPFQGFGVDICLLHRSTGLPCPGCGMTRAFVSLAHGDVSAAVGLNPFVLLAFPTFVVLAVLTLLPERARLRAEAFISRHAEPVARVYRLSLIAFLVFGVARLLVFLVLGERFP